MASVQLMEWMEQKKQCLLDFQAVTQCMLECEREELEDLVEKRGRLIEKIDQLDAGIQAELEGLEASDPIYQAVAGTLEGGTHEAETKMLFALSREMRSILGQIREDDIQASLRLRVEQEDILNQIREANQGGTAKGARFYSAAAVRNRGGTRLGNA